MKKNPLLISPLPFPCPTHFHSNSRNCDCYCRPSRQPVGAHVATPLSPPPPAARGGNGDSGKPQRSCERLMVAVHKSSPPACAHWWLWHRIESWFIPHPPPPSPAMKKQSIINHHCHCDCCNNHQHTPRCHHQRHLAAAAAAMLPLCFPMRCRCC